MTFQEVAEPAAEALVNLSQNSELAAKMVEMGMIKIAMDLLYKPDSSISRLLVMLLVNLTQLDDGISSLLQVPALLLSHCAQLSLIAYITYKNGKKRIPFYFWA